MGLIERLGLPPVPAHHRAAPVKPTGRTAIPSAQAATRTAPSSESASAPRDEPSALDAVVERLSVPAEWSAGIQKYGGSVKQVPGGFKVGIKRELAKQVLRDTKVAYGIPWFYSLEAEISVGGEATVTEGVQASVGVKCSGSAEFGPGAAQKEFKVGGFLQCALHHEGTVSGHWDCNRGAFFDGFTFTVYGTLAGGFVAEGDGLGSLKYEKEFGRLDLLVVSVGAYRDGNWGPISVRPGDGLRRIMDSLAEYAGQVDALVARKGVASTAQSLGNAARRRTEQEIALEAMQKRRVQEAERRAELALQRANEVGNPLNNDARATPGSPAREAWRQAMLQFWQPGVRAKQQMASLQGDERIAKALEAEALFVQARAAFQAGRALLR